MTQEFAIPARNHGTGIAQECLDGVASRRRLPFIAANMSGVQDNLCDFLLGGAGSVSVESPQHSSQACPLLESQPRIRWDRAAMQGGKEPEYGFDPVKTIETEGNDGGCERVAIEGAIEYLEMLSIAEISADIRLHALNQKADTPSCDWYGAKIVVQARWGLGQHNDACIVLRKPKNGCIRW